jgi:hypothetical protein
MSALDHLKITDIHLAGWGRPETAKSGNFPVCLASVDVDGLTEAAMNLMEHRINNPCAPLHTLLIYDRILSAE